MARGLHTSPETVGWKEDDEEDEDFIQNRTRQGAIPNEAGEGSAHMLARTAKEPTYA